MMSSIYEEFCKLRDQRRHGEEAPEYTEKRALELALARAAGQAVQQRTPRTVLDIVLEWEEFQRVTDLPAVHEALQDFSDDPTGDNGVYIVREVLRAAAPTAADLAGSNRKAGGAA